MDFSPPFCPYQDCPSHDDPLHSPSNWFIRAGFRPTKVVGPVARFRCKLCGKGFSSRTFDIDYWTHRSIDYLAIQKLLVGGSGIRQSCRSLGVSTRLLANRHLRLTRQAIALHSQALEHYQLSESLVFDGFESFAYSQYHPNNLHLLVTAKSQFVLGLHGAPLRRKGRMTEKQRRRRGEIEQAWRAPPNAIYKSCKGLLTNGCDLAFQSRHLPVKIISDEKKEYAWALERTKPYGAWREDGTLVHTQISSKASRTLANPLFPVNYLDRQLRKDLAEHVRESVRFAKRLEHSLERTLVHLMHHNYFKVFRSRSQDHEVTHAEKAGLDRQTIEELRNKSLRERALGWRQRLEDWQVDLWKRRTKVPIHSVTPLPRHLLTV